MFPRPLLPSVSRFLHTMQNMKCGRTYAVTSGGQRIYTHLGWYPSIITFFVYINQSSIDTIFVVNALASNPWMDARRKDLEILHQAPPPMCLVIFCVPDVPFI